MPLFCYSSQSVARPDISKDKALYNLGLTSANCRRPSVGLLLRKLPRIVDLTDFSPEFAPPSHPGILFNLRSCFEANQDSFSER